jgi:subtilase family serine protease
MKGLLIPSGQKCRFFGSAVSWRQWAIACVGIVTSLTFAPCGAFAQPKSTMEISPSVAKSTLLSAMDPAKEITIQLALPLSDPKGEKEFTQSVANPKDPLFHHFITVQEFAARFGGNAADFAAVKAWAVANQLTILHESSIRTSLTVRGTVAKLQTLFKTQLSNYKSANGDEFYSASVTPSIPDEIASKIYGVVGLTGGVQKAPLYKMGMVLGETPRTAGIHTDSVGGSGPGGTYAPKDLKTAYQIPTFGDVTPQTVAVFEQGGIVKDDITTFEKHYGLPAVPVTVTGVGGSDTKPNDGTIIEVDLDIQTIIGINPSVKKIQVYVADYNTTPFSIGLVDTFDAVAASPPDVLSVSYGTDEVTQGGVAIQNEAAALAAAIDAGVAVVISAGDDGAYGRTGTDSKPATLNVSDPGSQPDATCVGGTTLFTGPGAQYYGEEVWNDLGIGDGATGGGVSVYQELPFYQDDYSHDTSSLVTLNGGSATARNVPDVAALADPLTGVGVYTKAAGGWVQIGGTSLSAPIWAAYLSIVNAGFDYLYNFKAAPEVGNFDGVLYYTATNYYTTNYSSPAGALYPVLDGSNGNLDLYGAAGFNAGEYYNNCAGLGSLWGPYAFQLLTLVAGDTAPPAVIVKAVPATTSAKISWDKSAGATGYVVFAQLYEYNGNIGEYQATYGAQTTITKTTDAELKGLLANQEVTGPSGTKIPLYGYQVYVAAVADTASNAGASISEPLDFFTKE